MKQHIHLSSSSPAPTSRVVLKAISPNSKRKQPGIGLKKKRNVVILSSISDDSLENLPVIPVSLNVFFCHLTISLFQLMRPRRDNSTSLMTTNWTPEKPSLLN